MGLISVSSLLLTCIYILYAETLIQARSAFYSLFIVCIQLIFCWRRYIAKFTGTMSSSILVTGGAGYIGTHTVLQLLLGGYKAVVVDNLDNSSEIALKRVKELAGKQGSNLKFHKVLFTINLIFLTSFSWLFFFFVNLWCLICVIFYDFGFVYVLDSFMHAVSLIVELHFLSWNNSGIFLNSIGVCMDWWVI